MKLFLTGLPGTGKTTLVQGLIPLIKQAFWVTCREVRSEDGQRVGFKAETSTGLKGLLSHKQDIESTATIGDYKVDLAAIDRLLSEPIKEQARAGKFLIIDEIGRMQMLSPTFAEAIREVCIADTEFIATIRYGDEWTREFTERPDVITLLLAAESRDQAKAAIGAMVAARIEVAQLSDKQKRQVLIMAKDYAKSGEMIQLRKFYKNAVRYVGEGRVRRREGGKFAVMGDHGTHIVLRRADAWQCDCDLFNGHGQFAGAAGECSHIQAVKLTTLTL